MCHVAMSQMTTQSPWFANYKRLRDRDAERRDRLASRSRMVGSLQRHLNNTVNLRREDGFDRYLPPSTQPEN
jgi:hypothetical protein